MQASLLSKKVYGPKLITYLYQTHMIEWCVVRHGSKNGNQKTGVEEIGHTQILLNILGSIVNTIGKT